MAPYNFEHIIKWRQLTDDITEDVISRATPECGVIRTSAEFESCPDSERPKGQALSTHSAATRQKQSEDDLLPNLKVVPGTGLRFKSIPPLYPTNATPAEISQSHLDAMCAIELFLKSFDDMVEPIREIQLSFVLYLCGYSVDALAHWRKILGLLCKSDTAIWRYPPFYRRYLNVLRIQLPELPEELMMPTPNNTIFQDIGKLIVNCSACGLKEEANTLMHHLSSVMSWYFDDLFEEDPDDMPVVVDMD